MRVLIVGIATRAAAESAAQAGFAVTALDGFGDLDQHPRVRSLSVRRDFGEIVSAHSLARTARTLEGNAVTYLSNFENHPGSVEVLAAGRPVWGNSSTVLRRVRNPTLLTRTLVRGGHSVPAVRAGAADALSLGRRWLLKPLASGGGRHVRRWRPARRLPRAYYLQELIDGTPGSLAFVAAGGRAVPIGLSWQLVGEPAFGAAAYRYCGNILLAAGDKLFARGEGLLDAARKVAQTVAAEFGVVGLNGIDFVVRDGVPYVIEVNPRWSASMELTERAYGLSVFGTHAAACTRKVLPDFDLVTAQRQGGAVGKAVVFARREVRIGDSRSWLEDGTVRDVPHPGEYIPPGQPVCTVFATGAHASACHGALVERADGIYRELAAWERGGGSGTKVRRG